MTRVSVSQVGPNTWIAHPREDATQWVSGDSKHLALARLASRLGVNIDNLIVLQSPTNR